MTSATNQQSTKGEPLMQIAKAVQKIQRAETVAKFKDEAEKKQHFEDYTNAPKAERLKMFHTAIAEGWVS